MKVFLSENDSRLTELSLRKGPKGETFHKGIWKYVLARDKTSVDAWSHHWFQIPSACPETI